MEHLYVLQCYREGEGLPQEVDPFRLLVRDHLTRKDLRIAIDVAFCNAVMDYENRNMRVSIFKYDMRGLYFNSCFDPVLVCDIKVETRINGSMIDAYVTLEKPGSEPQRIRCINIA